MMASDFIMDVNESDFEYEVVAYSQNVPVIVDFWAGWCKPCKNLSPLLERVVMEAGGAFRLARVDVDANPNLAMRFSVRSLPTVKAFVGGQVVSEFVGLLPEPRLREFFTRLTPPSPANLAAEKAGSILSSHKWLEAEKMYREILDQSPDHEQPAAVLGLVKSLLGQNKPQEAVSLLRAFPASKQYNDAQKLVPYADALLAVLNHNLPDETDLDAAFENSVRLASRGKFAIALDGLLDIMRQERGYRNGKARQVILAILEIMGEDDPQTRQYRAELASILF
jgi:putative thioredoxin